LKLSLKAEKLGEVMKVKLWILVKNYDLVNDGVEVFLSEGEAKKAYKEYTEGVSFEEKEKHRENEEWKYHQTDIFLSEIELSQKN